jgi:hypothetical protein
MKYRYQLLNTQTNEVAALCHQAVRFNLLP